MLTFTVLGLLFTWSVALVQAPSANRAWPSRLLVTVVWLVSGLIAAYYALQLRVDLILASWLMFAVPLLMLCLLIAVNEREQWAPRVARQIPRSVLLRVPAFFFYSGAAGGILHAVGLFCLTALGIYLWQEYDPLGLGSHAGGLDRFWTVFEVMLMLFLYTYAYALSAVALRRLLLRQVQPLYTWVVMLLMAAVLSAVPLVIAMLWYQNQWNFGTHYLWTLTNPIEAAYAVGERRIDVKEVFYLFVGIWSALVTILNVPWFFRQLRRFKPYVSRSAAPPMAVLVASSSDSRNHTASTLIRAEGPESR
jgi:hypothetical protein